MKNLLLVAVILQLVITIRQINGKYQFGDIIAFPRKCIIRNARPMYKHYAVYVGPSSERDIGQGDNDIYHRTGKQNKRTCRFDKLVKTKGKWKEFKMNYLDGIKGFTVGTPDEIARRINETLHKCKRYNLFTNNCEHLATYVRYGVRRSLQRGTILQHLINLKRQARKLLEQVRKNQQIEARCEPNTEEV